MLIKIKTFYSIKTLLLNIMTTHLDQVNTTKMKTILLIATILLSSMLTKAEEIYFPSKEGVVLEYKVYDNKNRETGTTRYTIVEVNRTGDDMDITYLIETMDKDEKTQFKDEITVHKKGEKLYLDMTNMFKRAILKEKGEIPKQLEITGNDIITPSNLDIGDVLPDSHVNMAVKKGIINIKISINITDRTVEALETISVPAGSFEAYKITSNLSAKASIINRASTSAEWLVKGIGVVRSENYDKKGKLESYTELISIKG
jgi:hypothetical protein